MEAWSPWQIMLLLLLLLLLLLRLPLGKPAMTQFPNALEPCKHAVLHAGRYQACM